MTKRRLRLHLICEDDRQREFVERLANRWDIGPRQRFVHPTPRAKGAADRYVLDSYVEAVRRWRADRHGDENIALLVVIDGDKSGAAQRRQELAKILKDAGKDPIAPGDPVAILVPTWHIETWIGWLCGHRPVDEQTRYKVDRGTLSPAASEMARKIKDGTYTPQTAVDNWMPPTAEEEEHVPSLSDARRELKDRLGL